MIEEALGMGRLRRGAAACAMVLVLVGGAARGAIIFDSGTIHGTADAGGAYLISIPPPVAMTFGATHTYEASAQGAGASASARTTAGFKSTGISISGLTNLLRFPSGAFASASTSGTIAFHETSGQTLSGFFTWNAASPRGAASATLRDSSNAVLLQFFGTPDGLMTPSSASVFVPPGAYTLSWSHGTQPITGTGGQSSMSFSLSGITPEPASVSLLAIPAVLLMRRRRGSS